MMSTRRSVALLSASFLVITGVLVRTYLVKSRRRLVPLNNSIKTGNADHQQQGAAKVYLVGAGPGAADLITVRGLELLKSADVVMNDRLVSPDLLRHCKKTCQVLNVGKSSEKERFSQKDLETELIDAARRIGRDGIVVRLKGGDPYVFGLGASEGEALDKAGIEWEYVPGLSSAMALPGLCLRAPLTHKGVSSGFIVLSGHVPPKPDSEWYQLPRANEPMFTLVVIMCAKNLDAITSFLQNTLGWNQSIPAAVIQSGSTEEEKTLVSSLGAIASDAVAHHIDEAPLSLVIGKSIAVFPPLSSPKTVQKNDISASVWGQFRAKKSDNQLSSEMKEWWVFGYGSLIWRSSDDVPHLEVEDGYVEGFVRRFWQQSPDHRGTEIFPGRVATILPSDEHARLAGEDAIIKAEKVFGRVFRVDPSKIEETRDKLFYREKAGYEERTVEVTLKDGRKIKASVFLALPSNEHFIGPETPVQIAERIHRSIGPSGHNTEYFHELVRALREMRDRWGHHEDPVDPHLLEIEEELLKLANGEGSPK